VILLARYGDVEYDNGREW